MTLKLAPEAAWVAEAFPVESVKRTARTLRVTLAVSSLQWLERLLLQIGDLAVVESADPPLPEDFVHRAAQSILARYRA